ncbi:hypothetical protein FRC12_017372 [Ceratobasidium sp. 428]|nr:hypothetical protein FRC12_017372 [Ceratobasidium sp. 428]
MQSDIFHDSLKKWQTSYKLLTYAVGAFCDASDDLLQTVPQSYTSYVEKVWLEEALSQLRNDAKKLTSMGEDITNCQAVIHRATNTSTALVPISGLPLEIVSQIFALAAMPLACADRFRKSLQWHPLVTIPSVCTRWRELAISTRSLWSHIYMDEDFISNASNVGFRQWLELWLDRSDGAPLSLRFEKEDSWRVDVDQIASFLQPHISNVTSLMFYKSSNRLVHAILTLYGIHVPTTPLTTLSVTDTIQTTAGVAPRLIWPIDTLRGLNTLALCGLPASLDPSFDDLVQILLNNPYLHTLRIQRRGYVPFRNDSRPKISLHCLGIIELNFEFQPALERLLSMLDPGQNELDVMLTLPVINSPGCVQEILAFFERTNVTRLHFKNICPEYVAQLPAYLDSLPHLRVLCLSCTRNSNCTSLGALMMNNGDEPCARRSNLRSLSLSDMIIDLNAQSQLKQIVGVHHLDRLILGRGTVFRAGPGGTSNSKAFLKWLRRRVATVICEEMVN